jgi:hypothetical protein
MQAKTDFFQNIRTVESTQSFWVSSLFLVLTVAQAYFNFPLIILVPFSNDGAFHIYYALRWKTSV